MLRITNYGAGMQRRNVLMPDASLIPVKAVGDAGLAAQAAFGRLSEAERALGAARADVQRAEVEMQQAADAAAVSGKKIPKDVRNGLKAARDDVEQAEVEWKAYETAYDHAYRTLCATIEANRDKLKAEGIKAAERGLVAMASARKAVENAKREAFASFGLLGMLRADSEGDGSTPVYRQIKGSRHQAFTEVAVDNLDEALGFASLELEEHKKRG